MNNDEPHHRTRLAAETVGSRLDQVFAELTDLAPTVSHLLTAREVGLTDLGDLDSALAAMLARLPEIVDGAGVAFAPGALHDAPTWLQWWRVSESGDLEFARHVFDPNSVRYYDYTAMPWFALPVARGAATAVGPYLDSGGTDRNIVTAGIPCVTRNGTSLIAADLRVEQIEGVFRSALGTHALEAVLVNEHDRVVASTSAHHFAGSLLPPHDLPASHFTPVTSTDPGRLPWRVGLVG